MGKDYIDDCYVIGTSLLYLNELKIERLNQIRNNLIDRGVEVSLTLKSIQSTVLEWRDFFEFTGDSIILTKEATENKILVELVFNTALSHEVNKKLCDSIFNYPKTKIIQFPKNMV